MNKTTKIILRVGAALLAAILLFTLGIFVFHALQSRKEFQLLKEEGYYNPVSVGDYCLNVAKFGNENGRHTVVGLAGLGMGDYSVAARQMTSCIEDENLVVFVDRAGYGFSDDTQNEMMLSYIVEDYRKALKAAGVEAPYVLMPHSIGGAYANYWVSNYPEEIEGVFFVDGSQLSADAFSEEEIGSVDLGDRFLSVLAKIGFSRLVIRDYFYHYPDNYSQKEQMLGDALTYLTLDSLAPESESLLIAKNAQDAFNGIIANEVPKLYVCASWGIDSVEDIIETHRWINRQIEINRLNVALRPVTVEGNEELFERQIALFREGREKTIYPYAEKMGNCEVVLLAGDHMIYEQKPLECGTLLKGFLERLEG